MIFRNENNILDDSSGTYKLGSVVGAALTANSHFDDWVKGNNIIYTFSSFYCPETLWLSPRGLIGAELINEKKMALCAYMLGRTMDL